MAALKVVAAVFLFFALEEAKNCPRVVLVPEDSPMEKDIIASFENEGFQEVNMDEVGTESFPFQFKLKGRDPLYKIYLIVPKHYYANGSVELLQENRDFQITCSKEDVTVESNHVGFFLLSVMRKTKERGKRAISQNNMILNASMTSTCASEPTFGFGECSCNGSFPREIAKILNSEDDKYKIISHDVVNIRKAPGVVDILPSGNADVVDSCDGFISLILKKAKNGKINVVLFARGFPGGFVLRTFDGRINSVHKKSNCYKKICNKLKGKIKSLALITADTYKEPAGPIFLQCLADCLGCGAAVGALTKCPGPLFRFEVNATFVEENEWFFAKEIPSTFTPTTDSSMIPPTSSSTTVSSTTENPVTTNVYTEATIEGATMEYTGGTTND